MKLNLSVRIQIETEEVFDLSEFRKWVVNQLERQKWVVNQLERQNSDNPGFRPGFNVSVNELIVEKATPKH